MAQGAEGEKQEEQGMPKERPFRRSRRSRGWHLGLGCVHKAILADGIFWNLDGVSTRALTPWLEASCPIAGDPQAKSEWWKEEGGTGNGNASQAATCGPQLASSLRLHPLPLPLFDKAQHAVHDAPPDVSAHPLHPPRAPSVEVLGVPRLVVPLCGVNVHPRIAF